MIWLVPTIAIGIVMLGWIRGVAVFDAFVEGAKNGFTTAVKILPTLVALVTTLALLRSSGALQLLEWLLQPLGTILGLPGVLMPLLLLRPLSGSGALAVLQDLLARYGADSFIGRCAAVMCGSGETTFYTLSVYFGSVGVRNTRYALPAALLADVTAFAVSGLCCRFLL